MLSLRHLSVAATIAAVILLNTSAPATARTEVPQPTRPGPFADVATSLVTLPDPLPAGSGLPPACDELRYMRYRHRGGPTASQDADAVLVSMPGVPASAGSLEMNALNVVQQAADRGRSVEYWALDRRPNCLEDHTGMQAALRDDDPGLVLDYHFYDREIDGRRFAGFLQSRDLAGLPRIGLKQVLEDYRTVIVDGVPDAQRRRERVICGGHSLGGLLTGLLMAWDFDGDPRTTADRGDDLCAGSIALDTLATADPTGLRTIPQFDQLIRPLRAFGYRTVTRWVNGGRVVPRVLDVGVVSPDLAVLIQAVGINARLRPDEDANAVANRAPSTPEGNLGLSVLHSETWADLLRPKPRLRMQHLTGRALLGALLDDHAMPLAFLKHSVGTYDRGPVAPKQVPFGRSPLRAPSLGPFMQVLAGVEPLMIPARDDQLYGWRNFDEPAADLRLPDGRPYSRPGDEVTDIDDLARSLYSGPLDYTEQYFSMRLLTDLVFALVGTRQDDLARVRDPGAPSRKPRLTIVGADSFMPPILRTLHPRERGELVTLPGYAHMDLVAAAPRQAGGRPEQGAGAIVDFLLRTAR